MTREQAAEKEISLLLRRYNNQSNVKLKSAEITIPEEIIDILCQSKKRNNDQNKLINDFRKEGIEQLKEKGHKLLQERIEKARKTRETHLDQDRRYVRHFGDWINSSLPSARISREHYAKINPYSSIYSYAWSKLEKNNKNIIIDDEKQKVFYTEAWCKHWQERCLRNYDLNMQRFAGLDRQEFEESIQRFVKGRKFQQVYSFDEPLCSGELECDQDIVGYVYIMVLDEYKQAYIGITFNNIRERIRRHWKRQMPFDRLIFGTDETSILAIDSFGALDTTRIYVKPYFQQYKTPLEKYEEICIKAIDRCYLLNRIV